MKRFGFAIAAGICLLLTIQGLAAGAGFEVAETSGRQLGNAFAGKAAIGDAPSTVFYNPAGMMLLDRFEVAVAFSVLSTRGSFEDGGSTNAIGFPASGNDGGDPGGISVLPNLYFVAPISETTRFGVSINSPFGLKTEYEDGWQGRYLALESELRTVDVGLEFSVRLDDAISIGGGVDIQMADATLSNAIDFGTIGFLTFGPGNVFGLVPEGSDGTVVVESDINVGFGYNFGILIEASESTRFGITYRSSISHKLEGTGTFDVPTEAQVLTSTGKFTDSDVIARITLPDQIFLSGYHDINDQWAVMADVTWTNWRTFSELRVEFDNPAQDDAVTEAKWESAFRIAGGATYKPTDGWIIRVGAAWDESPIPDEYRTPRIPTNDRIWATIGVGWAVTQDITLDLSYMHVFIEDAPMEETAVTGQTLKGEFQGMADVLGFQFTINF